MSLSQDAFTLGQFSLHFSVSCLWSKNPDASNLEGSHWNRNGGIINLYLIPLVNKQGTLFHSQLFLVSRNLRSLWFNFLETKIPVIYLSSHLAPEQGRRSVYLASSLKDYQQILSLEALPYYTLVSRITIPKLC